MSRFETGWVKLDRADVVGPIGSRGNSTLGLWAKLLGLASRYDVQVANFEGSFPPGSVVTSLAELAGSNRNKDRCQVRRDLRYFEAQGKIKQTSKGDGRVITILGWETSLVENSENRPEIRPTFDLETTQLRSIDDTGACSTSFGYHLEKADNFSGSTQQQQTRDPLTTQIRPHNGEENKNKKEERVISTLSKDPIENENFESREPSSSEAVEELTDPAEATKGAPTPQDCAAPPALVGPAALLRIWNENRGTLPEAKALTAARKKSAVSRLREHPEPDYWAGVVRTIATSPFCTGENQRGWRASIDFLLRPDTHVKVTEGIYSKPSLTPKLKVKSIQEIYR